MFIVLGPDWLGVQSQASNPASARTQFEELDEGLSIALVAHAVYSVSSFSGFSFSFSLLECALHTNHP